MPLEWAFSRLGSALRELERTCHRVADLSVHGGEVELDKAIVDQLVDPLLHLLRNSMAHGIEPAPVRAERGKPARGRITLRATQETDFVHLTFEDDGGGIDRQAIRGALLASGQHDDGGELDDEALMNAIFEGRVFHARPVGCPVRARHGHEHRQARGGAHGRRDQD